MPAFLDSSDRRLLIAAVLVMVPLLVVTYVFAPSQQAQPSLGYPSSYSTEWGGAKAAFLLLGQLGYDVERWERSPEDLPSEARGTVLVLAEPFMGATPDELAAIRRFVSGGGRVIAMGASAANIVPDATAIPIPDWNTQPKTFKALLPSSLTRNTPEIAMVAPDRWVAHESSQLAIYGAEDDPVVVSYRVGQGEVIWWASASPVTNGIVSDKSNLALFLNSIGPESTRVLWDEYFHGARRSLTSYFAETPLPWAALQIGLVFLALLFTFSRRAGPIHVPAGESRLSPLEFVETLGDLYHSAHASPAAVGVAYQRFRSALSRKLGLRAQAKIPELCHAAAARFGWPEAALLDTLARSERATRGINPDEKEALDLVQRLHEYSAGLESRRTPGQEKS